MEVVDTGEVGEIGRWTLVLLICRAVIIASYA